VDPKAAAAAWLRCGEQACKGNTAVVVGLHAMGKAGVVSGKRITCKDGHGVC
jgi:hypothetical protein